MNEIFHLNNQPCNLRKKSELRRACRTVYYGTETISFLGPKIWGVAPTDLKTITPIF